MNKMLRFVKWGGVICTFFLLFLLGYAECKTNFYTKKFNKVFDLGLKFQSGDYWAIVGWTNTLEKLDYDADIVFFGNSITCGSDFSQYFDSLKICNLGYPGDNLDGMAERTAMVKAVKPEKVFLMAGINGLGWQTLEQFDTKYNRLVDSVYAAVPTAQIYLQSILPIAKECSIGSYASNSKIQDANRIIERIARERGMVYIDLFSLYFNGEYMPQELSRDGIHLKPASYDRWAEKIRPYVYESQESK